MYCRERDISCTRCVSHTGYLAHRNGKSETRGRSRYEYDNRRLERNLEEKNLGKKGKRPTQVPINAKVLTVMLPVIQGPHNIDYTKLAILT